MADPDVDDIFKDFENKVEDDKTTEKPPEEMSEEELKKKYQKAEQTLKAKYKKEREALEKKRETPEEKIPAKPLPNIEKIAYIGIILVLVAFIAIDLSFYHGKQTVGIDTEEAITAAAVQEEESAEIKEVEEEAVEEEPEEEIVEEEKELSGVITLTIDKIYTSVDDEDDDLGEISKVAFTINNGKDKILVPLVKVYAYDSNMDEKWETWRRGEHTFKGGIPPGKKHTGIVDLIPKKFTNLDLKKHVRLTLEDDEYGFITSARETVYIS